MTAELIKRDPVHLDLTGVATNRQALFIADVDAFKRAGAALAAMDECVQWWWGDYLLYAERYDLPTVLDRAHADLHRSTIYAHLEVSRFYPPQDRHRELSFTHHREIRYILGAESTLRDARPWLKRAAESKWSCGELREAMRKANRESENDPGPMRGVVSISDFVKISRWAEGIDAKEIPELQMSEIRESTKPLWNFLCQVHRGSFS